tara:strand:+ start:155 stop:553 length:399 start_codon:yes stop_codon:yes gene_type:complete
MLESHLLSTLKRAIDKSSLRVNEVIYPVIYFKMEKGQKVWKFNRSRDGLDLFVFSEFTKGLNGGFHAVLYRGKSDHPKNSFVESYFCRDLYFGLGSDCPSESYYLDEKRAVKALKKYLESKLNSTIKSLSQE